MNEVERNKVVGAHILFPEIPYRKGTPLQIVRWGGQRIGATFTSVSSAGLLLPSTIAIEITATENCYIRFGTGSGITAVAAIANDASRIFLSGVQVIPVPSDPGTGVAYTHIAVIQQSTPGILQVEGIA